MPPGATLDAMPDLVILWNAKLQGTDRDEAGRLVVRYLQVGVVGPHGFSGHVLDYCGGGEWDDLYYFEGEELDPESIGIEDEEEADECGADEYEDWLEQQSPGLLDAISAARETLFDLAESDSVYPVAGPALLEVIGDDPSDETLYSNAPGALAPVDGFNTNFDDA